MKIYSLHFPELNFTLVEPHDYIMPMQLVNVTPTGTRFEGHSNMHVFLHVEIFKEFGNAWLRSRVPKFQVQVQMIPDAPYMYHFQDCWLPSYYTRNGITHAEISIGANVIRDVREESSFKPVLIPTIKPLVPTPEDLYDVAMNILEKKNG